MLALLLFILALDSVILTRSAHELRIRLEQACEYAARDAVIEKRTYEAGGMAKYLARTTGAYTLNNLSGDIFIPVMPSGFTFPAGVGPNALPSTNCNGATDCGFTWGTNRLNCSCSKKVNAGDPPGFKDFTSANIDQDFDAGNYTGCTASATVRRFFLPNSTISASVAFWSIPYGLAPLGDGANLPTISVAIAPQVSQLTELASVPTYFAESVILDVNADNNYIDNIKTLNTLRPFFHVSLDGVSGTLAEPEYNLRHTGALATAPTRRKQLGAVCEHPAILVRQRLSSALLELLARNGLTRTQTEFLVVNPQHLAIDPEVIPPTIVTARGSDLAAAESFIPLMQTRLSNALVFGQTDNPHWIKPYYIDADLDNGDAIVNNPSLRARSEYEALIARLPGMCYHADNANRDRVGLNTASFDNSGFEPGSNFGSLDRLWSGNYSADIGPNDWVYFDQLRNTATQAPAPQVKLRSSEIASVLGASLRCPYDTDLAAKNPCPSSNLPTLAPDLVGLIHAWRASNASTQTMPLRNGTILHDEAPLLSHSTNKALVLFLQDFDLFTINDAASAIAMDADGFSPTGPITVVYIPTDATSAMAQLGALSGAFKTNLCAPTYQSGGRRSNTLIPIVSKGMAQAVFGPTVGPDVAKCMVGMSACFDQAGTDQATLEAVWECLLDISHNGREAENFTLTQIFQTNLMRTVRRL